ncbi:MAG: ribonuclease R [Candidatus Paceibacterota bacterium]|jgi:ribonuclease R
MKEKRNGGKFDRKDNKSKFSSKNRQKSKGKIMLGTIKAVRGNVAYFLSDQGALEVEISTRSLNTAMAQDKVEVNVFGKTISGSPMGEVTKVLERNKKIFVGTIDSAADGDFAIPDDRKIKLNILIPKEKLDSAVKGDKVLVKITKWKNLPNLSEGEVLEIIGRKGENTTEMYSVVLDRGFEIGFAEKVETEANNIFQNNKTVSKEEIAKRIDLRNTLTFTIDPKTAKDFDDAISFKALSNGNYEIGVHIADVSHYVRERSELDKEALKRGCSVYLPDRTIPMLPFELSDNLCSLNENEEKLAFSAIFEIDKKAKVLSRKFGKSVIKSAKRFTYESAQEAINDKTAKYHDELAELNRLAKIMRKEKAQKGAIDFEQDEVAFELDEKGFPIRIYKKERLDTHKLVEEFMLLANREVAEFVYKYEKKTGHSVPLPYRIHDFPDKERIAELAIFVKALGHELFIGKNGSVTGKDMQALFAQVEGKAEEGLVKTAAIRSMAKAIYSVKNIGHFGLAFEYYAHFTSPIRRYPDLLVHRLLQKILTGEKVAERDWVFYENAARRSTDQEIKASEAEREGKKYKQIEFMQNKIGQTFLGTITGVTEWGIYAEDSATRAEGMIKLSSLGDDYYVLDAKKYRIVGEKTKKTFVLGQKIKIKLIGADLDRRTMDYEIVS